MSRKEYWDNIYQDKGSGNVSWYQKEPSVSLRLIESIKLEADDNIIDVGGGASVLIDCLIKRGFKNVTILDISSKALAIAEERLVEDSRLVNWVVSDVTKYIPTEKYSLWHDRAAFHFLTKKEDRKKYRSELENFVRLGGYVIISSFSVDGPTKCSGLDVLQYDSKKIKNEIGPQFSLVDEDSEIHITPTGVEQIFNYFVFKKIA